jgi:hypothetical protein
MAKFNPGEWRHVRGSDSGPGGVIYEGTKLLKLPRVKGEQAKQVCPGQRISRRQYENMRYLQAGWANKSQFEAVQNGRVKGLPHEVDAYQKWRKIYSEEKKVPLSQVRGPDNPYAEAFAAAYSDEFKDTSPSGPLSHLLEVVGLRVPGDFWDVGDSPGK